MKYVAYIFVLIALMNQTENVHGIGGNSPEKRCEEMNGLKWADVQKIPKEEKRTDMLWRVTDMPDYYKRFGENSDNFCSVYHHGPDCGATEFVYIPPEKAETGENNVMFSYNIKTQTILRTYRKIDFLSIDTAITQGRVIRMDRIDANNKVTPIAMDQIPDFVKTDCESPVVMAAVAPHGNWFILRTCDGKFTWVKLIVSTERGIASEKLKQYEQEVDRKLNELQIEKSTLKTVALELPFHPPTALSPVV